MFYTEVLGVLSEGEEKSWAIVRPKLFNDTICIAQVVDERYCCICCLTLSVLQKIYADDLSTHSKYYDGLYWKKSIFIVSIALRSTGINM